MTRTDRLEAALEAELIARLEHFARPATIADLFDEFEPKWAVAAAERCIIRGILLETDGLLTRPEHKALREVASR